jgi:hypothetical protein
MKRVLLVTLLVLTLAAPSAVLFAAPDAGGASAPLTKGTPVPTPEQPPEIEEGWVLTTGCVIQTYGDSAPWTFKIWFKYLGGFGYASSYIYYYTGTQVLAEVYPGPSPMGVRSIAPNILDPWCDPTGEPLGALDGGVIGGSGVAMRRVSGLARELPAPSCAPDICPGSWDNDTQATATLWATGITANDSVSAWPGTTGGSDPGPDDEDWFMLTGIDPWYTGRTWQVKLVVLEGRVLAAVYDNGQFYPLLCSPGQTCIIQFVPTAGGQPVYLHIMDDTPGVYDPMCKRYYFKYVRR